MIAVNIVTLSVWKCHYKDKKGQVVRTMLNGRNVTDIVKQVEPLKDAKSNLMMVRIAK